MNDDKIERLSEEVDYLKANVRMLKSRLASMSAATEPDPIPVQQQERRAKVMEEGLKTYGHGKAYRDATVTFADDGIHVVISTKKGTFVRTYIAVERTIEKWTTQTNEE